MKNYIIKIVGILVLCLLSIVEFNEVIAHSINKENEVKLEDWKYDNTKWKNVDGSLTYDVDSKEMNYALSEVIAKDFSFSADIKFDKEKGNVGLIFRSNSDAKNTYLASIKRETGEVVIAKYENGNKQELTVPVRVAKKDEYHISVTAIGQHIAFSVDNKVVASTADYVNYNYDMNIGQSSIIKEGYLGVFAQNTSVTYDNISYEKIEDKFGLDTIEITPENGDLEYDIDINPNQYTYLTYVSNDTTAISIDATAFQNANISYSENVIDGMLKLEDSINPISLTVMDGEKKVEYKVLIIKRKQSTYYEEPYRNQYHYSVKEGWANDPNGMVYYNGVYHLFYQFYFGGTDWGPMHWAHATSIDLINWEEQPITFLPDEYGTMFSGCAVVDENNDSGLFNDGEGGLVALITANGNGQRLIAAYSSDGVNWNKKEGTIIDWTEDELSISAFRDPKVFRYENKWFMVIAGGPLRIYSSDNLLDWQVESTYPNLNTECPDLYRLPVVNNGEKTGEYKWVLSRGGRFYKVGDFLEVDGKWTFVPDKEYEGDESYNNNVLVDGIMNFGRDSYAAMTYYKGDFGTLENVNEAVCDDVIEINWMNTWDNYCNLIDEASDNTIFNGTFNLQLKLALTKVDGKYVLTQTPIEEYESLRGKVLAKYSDKVISPDKNIKKKIKGDCYEIVAKIVPDDSTTRVGFKLRVGEEEETLVYYDISTSEIIIDRSNSGNFVTDVFLEPMRQKISSNDDGSIDLHLFIDKSSVEVFANKYTIAGAAQILPSENSNGVEVFTEGGQSKITMKIYSMNSIWNKSINSNNYYIIGGVIFLLIIIGGFIIYKHKKKA